MNALSVASKKEEHILGTLDSYNNGLLEGWAYNPQTPTVRLGLSVYIDGKLVTSGLANTYRRDLEEAKINDAIHAFRILLPDAACDGAFHEVDVRLTKSGTSLPGCPRRLFLSKIVPVYDGYIELIDLPTIAGWAWNERNPHETVEVEIFADDEYLDTVDANKYRQDLADAGIGDGKKAFAFNAPIKKNACIKAIVKGSDFALKISPEIDERHVSRTETAVLLQKPRQKKPAIPTKQESAYQGEISEIKAGRIIGWTIDTQKPANSLEVELKIDGKAVANMLANEMRESIKGTVKGSSGKHGFSIEVPRQYLDGKNYPFTVSVKGTAFVLASKNKAAVFGDKPSSLEGYILGAKFPDIKGWAWDKQAPNATVSVDIFIAGKKAATVKADHFRKEILEAGKGDGKKAFAVKLPEGVAPAGEQELKVKVSGTDFELKNCPAKILIPAAKAPADNKKTTPAVEGYEGNLERADHRGITGWAWDKSQPDQPIAVEIVADGEVLDICIASTYRQDLEKAGKGNGEHAFRLPTPPLLCDGKPHEITARIAGTKKTINKKPLEFFFDPTRPYGSYEEYYDWALLNREVYEPHKENDMRVFGYMEWYKDLLIERYKNRKAEALVSIVMPTCNRAGIVREAIISILDQTYRNWELLVVDDGSVDNTLAIVRTFKDARIHLIEMKQNVGVSRARNAGLKQAKGEFIAYLDSDNTWDENFLKLMVHSLEDQPEYEAIYCVQHATEIHKSAIHGERELHFTRFGPFNRSLIENRNFLDLNCYMHRRSLYDELGGFDDEMRRLVDWEMILRYSQEKSPYPLPASLTNYYYGKVNNQITTIEKIDVAEELFQQRLRKNTFSVTDLPTLRQYEERPDYEFFSLNKSFKKEQQGRFVSIIIASYEAAQYLDYCIASVRKFTQEGNYELIIADNASSPEVITLLSELEEKHDNIKVVYNASNTGFTYATNQGIEMARPDSDIVLLNNDALVTEGWIPAMQDVLKHQENVGLVVPRQTLIPKTNTMEEHVPYGNPRRELDVSLSVHHKNILDVRTDPLRGYVDLTFAPFFCVYITRECLDIAGPLNAKNGRHYRSDRLYCDVVREYAGMRMVYTPHSKLYHFLQQSTKQLKTDAKAYQKIFVDNTWDDNEKKLLGIK